MQPKLTGTTDIIMMGIAAQLPGLKMAIMELQAKYDGLRAQLAQMQEAPETAREYIGKRIGRPPSKNKSTAPGKRPGMLPSGWPADPEERKAEYARRRAVGMGKAPRRAYAVAGQLTKRGVPAKMHPRDPRHPGHEEYIAKLKKSQRKFWNNLSPAAKKARVDTMLQHRRPAVKLEKAS